MSEEQGNEGADPIQAFANGEAAPEKTQEAPQEKILGKFNSTDELQQAYTELETKLGKQEPEKEEPVKADLAVDTSKPEVQAMGLPEGLSDTIVDAEKHFAEHGSLSDDIYAQLQEKHNLPKEYVDGYINQRLNAAAVDPTADITGKMLDMVGGVDKFQEMGKWANANWDKADLDNFNDIVTSSDPNDAAISVAVKSLAKDFERSQAQLIAGKATSIAKPIYESNAQVMSDMSDPRYAEDPAFRKKVAERLSNTPKNLL